MDSKALAKSKRAHSLHNSKKQPNSSLKAKAKAASGGGNDAGGGNKVVGKQAREKARQSGLPSNWDRYEEEFDVGPEHQVPGSSANKDSDVVFPKSKGADYRHLIAEAQSQCQSNSYLDPFSSLDDLLPDGFNFGMGPMLSVRGEGILSWIQDDNFVVEDETAANPEAHFLSLNLNALAEQLEKVDISKRLFIEEDLVRPEQSCNGKEATTCSLELDQMQSSETEVSLTVSKDSLLRDSSEKNNKVAKHSSDVTPSGAAVNVHLDPISRDQESYFVNQQTGDLNSSRVSNFAENRDMEPSTFEAELDVLLDSLSETKLLDSSGFRSLSEKEAPRALPQFIKNTMSSLKMTSVASKLDDDLDNLLEETSNLLDQNNPSQPMKANTLSSSQIQSSSSSQSVTKSKVLDDFDSWFDTV